MKKFLQILFALIIFFVPLTVAAADSATEKLIQMERDTYGAEQPGAILDRISKLEKDYSGKNMVGNMNVRIDSVYEILYGNIGAPSILAKINAIEWNAYNEVSGKSIQQRLNELEQEILGKNSTETFIKRIDSLAQASFGRDQIPLVEMQVSRDILIKVILAESVGTRNLQVGDMVDISVAENIFVDGKLVFAKGLPGKGRVRNIRKAKGWIGQNGKMQIDFYELNCIDGNGVEIFVGEESKNEMTARKMIKGASLVGMNLNDDWNKLMVHGKNLEVYAGTELYVQTSRPANIYGLNVGNKNLNPVYDMAE